MTKLQLVGEPATAELAGAVMSDHGAAFMRSVPKAAQIQLERAHAATQDALYNDAQLQVKRLLAEMTESPRFLRSGLHATQKRLVLLRD